MSGFGVFVFSDFPISVSLDVASHEFTHGVKQTVTGPSTYENVTGAIEEGYADILGNLTEMIVEPEKSDTKLWSLAEQSAHLYVAWAIRINTTSRSISAMPTT